jgi:hypothetical protein
MHLFLQPHIVFVKHVSGHADAMRLKERSPTSIIEYAKIVNIEPNEWMDGWVHSYGS